MVETEGDVLLPIELRLPVHTTTTRDLLTNPVEGTIIFNTQTNKINLWDGSGWVAITSV